VSFIVVFVDLVSDGFGYLYNRFEFGDWGLGVLADTFDEFDTL
jgi:hypothetical protein